MVIIIVLMLVAACSCEKMLVTPEYTEYLKATVDWEVVDYEDNIFKGWTVDEFKTLLGDQESDFLPESVPVPIATDLPSSINWKGSNCVHKIYDQGNCGSCWAVATTGVISDSCCLQNKDYGWLGPQELVSCVRTCSGCYGGMAGVAVEYIQKHGLVPESCFPYQANDLPCPTKCQDQSDWNSAHVCRCKEILDCGTVAGMKTCLKEGPIIVRMLCYPDFDNYKSGIYCWNKQGEFLGGHVIRCLGYSDTPKPYLTCANSWGTGWGMDGYFMISLEEGCGLRLTPHDTWAMRGC